jgi:heme exporter protein D
MFRSADNAVLEVEEVQHMNLESKRRTHSIAISVAGLAIGATGFLLGQTAITALGLLVLVAGALLSSKDILPSARRNEMRDRRIADDQQK